MTDYLEAEATRLAIKYADDAARVDQLITRMHNFPMTIESEDDLRLFAPLAVECRDYGNDLETKRVTEKEPHLRLGQTVDSYFKGLAQRVSKVRDICVGRIDHYNQRKLSEERVRRAAEQRRLDEEARAARALLEEQECAQREAERAAARARNDERIAELNRQAAEHQASALAQQQQLRQAQQAADDARIEANAKSSDLVRSRTDEGRLVTMRQVPHIEIVDRLKLDMTALLPHLRDEDLLRAIKNWAKLSAYRTPMPGAIIEMRDVTEIR